MKITKHARTRPVDSNRLLELLCAKLIITVFVSKVSSMLSINHKPELNSSSTFSLFFQPSSSSSASTRVLNYNCSFSAVTHYRSHVTNHRLPFNSPVGDPRPRLSHAPHFSSSVRVCSLLVCFSRCTRKRAARVERFVQRRRMGS